MKSLFVLLILLLNTLTITAYNHHYEARFNNNCEANSDDVLLSGISVLVFLVACLIGMIKKWLGAKDKNKE